MRSGRAALAVVVGSLCACPSLARADYPGIFGYGPESVAQAGAGVATADDTAATFMNPAGLPFARRPQLWGGMTYAAWFLHARGQYRPALRDPDSSPMGFVVKAPGPSWLARNVVIGLGINRPSVAIARTLVDVPSEPRFAYYEGRLERTTLHLSGGVRILPRVSLGLGLNLFARSETVATVVDAPGGGADTLLREVVHTDASLVAGLRVTPIDSLTLAFVYRQQYAVQQTVRVRSGLFALSFDDTVFVQSAFSPHELVAGAALNVTADTRFTADLLYASWAGYRPFATTSPSAPVAGGPFRDVLGVRMAVAWRAQWSEGQYGHVRAGLGYETSPIPEQTGATNLLDSNRTIAALGGSLELPPLWGIYGHLQLSAQWHHLLDRTYTKTTIVDDDPTRPGTQTRNAGYPSISFGGDVLTLFGTLEGSF